MERALAVELQVADAVDDSLDRRHSVAAAWPHTEVQGSAHLKDRGNGNLSGLIAKIL